MGYLNVSPAMTRHKRFVVLGTGAAFTFHVIDALVENEYLPLAYVQSGTLAEPHSAQFADIEIEQPVNDLEKLLIKNNIPLYYEASEPIDKLVARLKADYLLVACWPTLLPDSLINSVSIAALNLHPSLLPNYRGFDPISEQLTRKDHNFGITLHLLNQQFDQGDIVLQTGFKMDNHPAAENINREAAIRGAELFIRAVNTHEYPGWILKPQLL